MTVPVSQMQDLITHNELLWKHQLLRKDQEIQEKHDTIRQLGMDTEALKAEAIKAKAENKNMM